MASGSQAWIRLHGGGSRQWSGVVSGLSHVEAKNIPPQLAQRAGGDVATQQDPVAKTEKPQNQRYLVAIRFQEMPVQAHPGVMGRVKIAAGARTLWWRCQQFLATTFNWGL